MAITEIKVPANKVQEGHVVDNRLYPPLEVLNVDAWCNLGKITYKISVGRDGVEVFNAELNESHVLTYTYVDKGETAQ